MDFLQTLLQVFSDMGDTKYICLRKKFEGNPHLCSIVYPKTRHRLTQDTSGDPTSMKYFWYPIKLYPTTVFLYTGLNCQLPEH